MKLATAVFVAAGLVWALAPAPARALPPPRGIVEVMEESDLIVVAKVTAIDVKPVAGRKWDVATLKVEKVLMDRAEKPREPKMVALYVMPHRDPPPGGMDRMIMGGPPSVKVGQNGVWLLNVPVNFVGYRHGPWRFYDVKAQGDVEAVIRAERDPMKALKSESVTESAAGAYFWWSIRGRQDAEGKREKREATAETTRLVIEAVAAGIQPGWEDAGYGRYLMLRNLIVELGLPSNEIFPPDSKPVDRAQRLRKWYAGHPGFRLTEYVEKKPAE